MFAKTKGVKNPCSIKYPVEELWVMGPKYFRYLLKQLRNVDVGSDVDKEIMDTMISIPATDESGEKVYVSVIDSLNVAKKFFTPTRIYAIHHRWDLPVLHYHEIMVIYPYPFLVVITQLFSCIIFINDCIYILTGSPR